MLSFHFLKINFERPHFTYAIRFFISCWLSLVSDLFFSFSQNWKSMSKFILSLLNFMLKYLDSIFRFVSFIFLIFDLSIHFCLMIFLITYAFLYSLLEIFHVNVNLCNFGFLSFDFDAQWFFRLKFRNIVTSKLYLSISLHTFSRY